MMTGTLLVFKVEANEIWVDHSQFATIRNLNGFARIRPGFAMFLDMIIENPCGALFSPLRGDATACLRIDSQFALIRKMN